MGGSPRDQFERNAGGKFARAESDGESRLKYVIGEIASLERQAKIPGRPLTVDQQEHLENMRKEKAELEAEQKPSDDFEEEVT